MPGVDSGTGEVIDSVGTSAPAPVGAAQQGINDRKAAAGDVKDEWKKIMGGW